MDNLKKIDLQILSELLKNARSSDRQIAKKLRVSQPTVTRRRTKMEKEVIESYTTIPKWEKLGFEILAIIFLKSRVRSSPEEVKKKAVEKGGEWVMNQPNILFVSEGTGFGKNGVIISLHKNYSDYSEFLTNLTNNIGDIVGEPESFLIGLERVAKRFDFKYIGDSIQI